MPRLIDAAFCKGIYPVSPLHINREPDRTGLAMGYALRSPESLSEGVRRLATAIGQGMIRN